jgi:hypothetical protein
MAVGYLFIIVFHLMVLIVYLIHFRKSAKIQFRVGVPLLLIISFFFLAVEKVMFDEVAHEYYIEFPMPGETHFIAFGLLVNGIFILYSVFAIYKWLVGVKHSVWNASPLGLN